MRGLRTRLGARRARQRLRDVLLPVTDRDSATTFREDLARRYLQGHGIEIGALQKPLRVPPAAHVRYVDVMNRAELVATYTSAVYGDPDWVVSPDFIDDCERLSTFEDCSADFVIANHILEHTEDPIAALKSLVRVLRPNGILFLTLPDPRHTFDALRSRTTVTHLLRDHEEGPEASRHQHYREWALVECLPEDKIPRRIAQFEHEKARHHFHLWELDGFLDFLRTIQLPATLEHAQVHLDEFAVVMRRLTGTGHAKIGIAGSLAVRT